MDGVSVRGEPGDEPRDGHIDAFLIAEVERHQLPGLSAGVLHGGQLVHLAGYGQANLELGVHATGDTMYELASVTKPITATAVLLLAEDGVLDMDGSVTAFDEPGMECQYIRGRNSDWTHG